MSVSAQGQILFKRTRPSDLNAPSRPGTARRGARTRTKWVEATIDNRANPAAIDLTTTRIEVREGGRLRTRGPVARFGRVVWTLVAASALALAYGASVADPAVAVAHAWIVAGYAAACSLPLIAVAGRLRRAAPGRAAWGAMAGSLAASVVAGVAVEAGWSVPGVPGAPSTASLLRVLAAALLALGVAGVARQRLTGVAATTRLDAVIAGLAVSAGVGLATVEPELTARAGATANVASTLLALTFVALVAVVVFGLTPTGRRPSGATALAIAAAGATAVGCALALHHPLPWPLGGGRDLNVASLASAILVGFAAATRDRAVPALRARGAQSAPVASLVPVGAGLAAIALVAVSWRDAKGSFVVPVIGFGALLLVLVRLWMTLREESHLITASRVDARTDPLTGLPNRRSLLEQLESLLDSGQVRMTGVVLIDLDGFKEVNDSLGHLAGDRLLAGVGERFHRHLGGEGVFGRLGGDEFAFVSPTSSEDELVGVANGLMSVLSDPYSVEGVAVHVGASMGIAVAASHETSAVELLRGADVAMYEAKRLKSGVSVYRTNNDPNSREQLALLSDLRHAIDARALTLHYQPTIDMRTEEVRGVEALARWNHPTLGVVLPERFIPMTERAGLMPQLTRAVLVQAIEEAGRLRRAGHRLQMSVNISRYDLLDDDLPTFVARVLALHSVPAGQLTIEITESCLGTDPDRGAECVRRLRGIGARIAIDDYGVGYSSMSQLLEMSIDELKIDKSFVVGLPADLRAEAIVRSAIELARALGVSLVTEGIESEESLRALQAIGADIGQGYYIARPLTPTALRDYLRAPDARRGAAPSFELQAAGVD